MNNIQTHGLYFCCGAVELGNFNYVDPKDGKQMPHYHNIGGSWKAQQNAAESTEKDILDAIRYASGGVICSTGAGQEYVEPILEKIGFKRVFTFRNSGHAQTPISIWCYSKNELPLGTLQDSQEKLKEKK